MGEAYLVRKGGAVFRGLELISPPDNTDYFLGQYADMTGTIVGARFGTFTVPLHDTAWTYTPTRALESSDTEITISATIGRQTRSIGVPITVEDFASSLNDNTWEQIQKAAELGIADDLWDVGDIKYDYFGDVYVGFRIIGFGHDDLDETDARYNDPTYNGNTKKAAITFEFVTTAGQFGMNTRATQIGGWDASNMRTTRMQLDKELLPEDLQGIMRTVKKWACAGGVGPTAAQTITKSADEMFLLSIDEMNVTTSTTGSEIPSQYEKNYVSVYEWYNNGNLPATGQWSRSCHDPLNCDSRSHFCSISEAGKCEQSSANVAHDYYPAFCI